MSVSIFKEESYFFISDPNSQGVTVSSSGGDFTVLLNSPIRIPYGTVAATMSCIQANIWNVVPNISPELKNDQFEFTTANAGNPGTHTLTIPKGLYSLTGLNAYLSTQFTNLGLPSNLITLSGDDATQKSILTFLEISGPANDHVDFTIANSVRTILGFDSRISPAAGPQIAGFADFGDNTAVFNITNSFLIQSDITPDGIPINANSPGVVASVPIDAPPGSQVVYSPEQPLEFDAMSLRQGKQSVSFRLLNQATTPLDTNGEQYSLVLRLKYQILMSDKNVPLIQQ